MIKVDIISGFLGAGKTTLIKHLLGHVYKNENVVLIENEFGEIGIDGGFLKEAGIKIREMNSGCICCSLVGDFAASLKEVVDTYQPERIIIEPSGVGKLSDVERAVVDVAESLQLEISHKIVVADVTKCKMYLKNFGEFYKNQIENANTIILSRTDIAKEEKTEEALALIKEINSVAAIVTTPVDKLADEILMKALENKSSAADMLKEVEENEHHHDGECCCHHDHHDHEHHHHDGECCHHHDDDEDEHEHHHHHDDDDDECECGCHDHHDHHHHHADEVFTSWGKETAHPYEKQELAAALEALDTGDYGQVLRAKGIVAGTDGKWLHFDYVPGEVEIRNGAAGVTGRLCVIGAELKEDALTSLFHLN